MRIAVSAQGSDMDSLVDPRFGRAQAFVVVDQATGECSCMDNANRELAQSAGIQSAQMVADSGARAVITGRVGPKAQAALMQAGLTIYFAPEGATVRQAVEALAEGRLESMAAQSSAADPAPPGMGRGFGGGCRGGGRGRGMGGGGGRGMGGGGCRGMGGGGRP